MDEPRGDSRDRPDTPKKVVGVSGTFNVIHRGHQALLRTAFRGGELVLIGLTTDDFAASTRTGEVALSSFQDRRKALQDFLASADFTRGRLYKIVPLGDNSGPALEMKDFHVLVVSPETLPQGERINRLRQEKGLPKLELVLVPHVMAEDRRPISATRVLRKEIDREGMLNFVFSEKELSGKNALPPWLSEGEEGQPVLVQSCCAGCLLNIAATLEAAEAGAFWPVAFWYNPNVHPLEEHRKRQEALKSLAVERQIPVIVAEGYDIEEFFDQVPPGPPNARCRDCYRLRLERTAKMAAALDIPAFTTTLLCSPYQDHEHIRELGEELAGEHGITFLYQDFRKGFNKYAGEYQETGLHHQNYCGCLFSQKERFHRPSSP